MRKGVLFLAGHYLARDFPFYVKLARGRFKVAVDGGYRFFEKTGLVANLLIGDFDSLKRLPRQLSPKTLVLRFPTDKNKTDAELAVDYCLEQGVTMLDLVQPGFGDPDHFLANLFLLTRRSVRARGGKQQLRLVGPDFEAFFVSDSRISFSRARGCVVSVIPVSKSIRLTCRGTAFNVSGVRIERGETRPTRNRITAGTCSFEISGQAFVVRHLARRRGII